jgi:hypothetical protein
MATKTTTAHRQKILTVANYKTKKGEAVGYKTFGIHFASGSLSGFNVCTDASEGCLKSCLNGAGMGAFSTTQKARITKTQSFHKDVAGFMASLISEIRAAIKSATKLGMIPCVRLNLTSDIYFERIKLANGNTIFQEFPEIQFYDYTKHYKRMFLEIPNYHLTFSRSENVVNQLQASHLIKLGKNVASVFSTKKGNALPESYKGTPVIDGDENDLRFLDPKGCYVGLRAKGPAKKDQSGFVIHV